MELIIKLDDKNCNLNFDKNIILFGKNNSYKNKFINELTNSLTKNKNNILINGKVFNTNDFNIININEETDFSNEFKFTKNNTLRQLIYNDISKKINENKIIEYTNEIFDIIDEKINNLLDKKINKKNIFTKEDMIDYCKLLDNFNNLDLYCNDIEINSVVIDIENNRIRGFG